MSRTTIRNRDGLAGNQIRILPGAGVVLRVSGFPDVERITAGEGDDSIQSPPASNNAGQAVPIPGERHFPNIARYEPLALIHGTAVAIICHTGGLTNATALVDCVARIVDQV